MTLVCESYWSHHFGSSTVATMTWIKSYTWLISYNIWHSYVNHVEVITLKTIRSPPWLELRVILGWYLIIYDTRMWITLKSSLWRFYGRHHDLVNHYRIHVSQIITGSPGNHTLSFPQYWLITRFVTRLTRRVPHVEEELHTL
jgi:hypothetical protein